MNVLEVNKFYYPRGGAEQHMLDVIDLLKLHGDHVSVFAMQHEKNIPSDFGKYFVSEVDLSGKTTFLNKIKASGRLFYSCEAKRKMKKLLHNEHIDIAHLHNIYHHISPSILPVLKKKNIPVVMTIHDYKLLVPNYTFYHHGKIHLEDGKGWYLSCMLNRCVDDSFFRSVLLTKEMIFHHKIMRYYERLVDHFIAPTQFVKDIFVQFGWDEKKITVLNHFLSPDVPRITRASAQPNEVRFAYVGRLSHEKGVKKLVDTWIENNIQYPLDLFGRGPEETAIRAAIKEAGADHIVLHGFMPREELFPAIRKHTAVILPTHMYEVFGLSVMEAFAQGVPAIAHRVGGLPELIGQSEAGLLFDWENPASLVQALEDIQNGEFRKNAVRYMQTHHRPDDYYQALKDIYESVR